MLTIECPWCGPRGEAEFSYGGEPAVRPVPASAVTDAQWADYLYMRTNTKGRETGLWCHAGGCGQWFRVERSTVTHEVFATSRLSA